MQTKRPPESRPLQAYWFVAGIFVATFFAYLPSLSGGFLWDDDGHVTTPSLRSITGLGRIWFEPGITQQYYPLLHSAFWLESQFWADNPLGYRLVNLLLHATSACLFAAVLRRLSVPGAWFAAFLFALHPVCVESVAWISEQKNALSLVFYLGAALIYLRFEETRRPRTYVIATALFVAALLTKTVTATLPAALLVVAWWRRGGLEQRRDIFPVIPWFVLSIGAAIMTSWFEKVYIGAEGELFTLSWVERMLLAGRIAWFYLEKLALPLNLTFIYPRWEIDASVGWQWLFLVGAVAVSVYMFVRKRRAILACWLLFVGSLTPALGFINVYPFVYSYVADHFQYLACLAPLAGAAALLTRWTTRLPRVAAMAIALGLPVLLGVLTLLQSRMYRDEFTLYETTLERNPSSWMAHTNLARLLTDSGRPLEAIPHLEKALRLRADLPEAENNLGYTLTVLGRSREGIPHLQRALALKPQYIQAYNNLGHAYVMTGDLDAAIKTFREALRREPKEAGTYFNLGLALAQSDRTCEAIPEFERAVKLRPDYADAELNWGIGLMLTGSFPAAVPHFERAIELDPDSARYHALYARALAGASRWRDAEYHYSQSLEIDPAQADVHLGLAGVLRQLGRSEEAALHYQEAGRLQQATIR
ncbi:MAG: tetratricopeptide repeat protein [Nibricoccus sp.]